MLLNGKNQRNLFLLQLKTVNKALEAVKAAEFREKEIQSAKQETQVTRQPRTKQEMLLARQQKMAARRSLEADQINLIMQKAHKQVEPPAGEKGI